MDQMNRRPINPLDRLLTERKDELRDDVRQVMKALERRDELLRIGRKGGGSQVADPEAALVLEAFTSGLRKRRR